MLWKTRKSNYIFRTKKNPQKGIISAILGIISVISVYMSVYLTYMNKGVASMQYGNAVFLAFLYSITGLVLGIMSIREQNIYKLFPVMGLILNFISITICGFILFYGLS